MEKTIDVKNLCKSYAGIPALTELSFTVSRGEVFGLLGANGAGKSTALECVLGTKSADSGSARILGMNPAADRKMIFQRVGVQFQESSFQDKITVRELCEETETLYRSPAGYSSLLARLGLDGKAKSPVSELSGGQKQRLFIVLALIPGPEVVFLDELTTGLDARARRDVWKYLLRLKKEGLTIVLTSHFMDEVEALCDRLCILRKGRTVFSGTVSETIAASPHDSLEDAYLWFTGEEETEYESV
ncbi:ABC transporter ATP-binding protein [Candidatus Soleaferrea massiliensis]|uniref:ABC transporter ATP-binding protein n=1 Tax=Candidatus Soleaferrea massiliensis TaxID=1470354 RepID=UPI00058BD873|nr:ABC transporter ATP-binding protein [Candidatus Soleaferrea massiliensis]